MQMTTPSMANASGRRRARRGISSSASKRAKRNVLPPHCCNSHYSRFVGCRCHRRLVEADASRLAFLSVHPSVPRQVHAALDAEQRFDWMRVTDYAPHIQNVGSNEPSKHRHGRDGGGQYLDGLPNALHHFVLPRVMIFPPPVRVQRTDRRWSLCSPACRRDSASRRTRPTDRSCPSASGPPLSDPDT
jgi:hypothetical protein